MIKSSKERAFELLKETRDELQNAKPNDRSSVDRAYAICITDLERVTAYFDYWINRIDETKEEM